MDTRELRNEAGQTLTEFLRDYNPKDYERPSVTVDMAVCTQEGELLLIQRRNHPNIGQWALPGGFMEMEETLYESAVRELKEETGVTDVGLHSLGLFAAPDRDPRTRIITAAFTVALPQERLSSQLQAGDDAADARLFRWHCESLGDIAIPPPCGEYPYLSLPCSATGEPHSSRGQGYLLSFENGEINLSLCAALSEDGVELLLASPAPQRPHDGALAGDHGLIIFSALRKLGKI